MESKSTASCFYIWYAVLHNDFSVGSKWLDLHAVSCTRGRYNRLHTWQIYKQVPTRYLFMKNVNIETMAS